MTEAKKHSNTQYCKKLLNSDMNECKKKVLKIQLATLDT